MADFSYEVGGVNSPITPQQPVQDNSRAVGLEFLGNAINTLGNAAGDFIQIRDKRIEAEQEGIKNQALASFSADQLRIVDAVESGAYGSSEGRMRMRKNLSQYIANNPAASAEITKLHNSLIKSSGLGNVITEGTQEEIQMRAVEDQALRAGWIYPTMSADQKQAGIQAFFRFNQATTQLEYVTKQAQAQSAQIGVTNAQLTTAQKRQSLATGVMNQKITSLNLSMKENQVASRNALSGVQGSLATKTANDLEAIRVDLDAGKIDRETAVRMANQKIFEVEQFGAQIGASAGADYVNALSTPMRNMAQNYVDYLSGKTTLETLNNQTNINTATVTAQMGADPELAKYIATNKLLPQATILVQDKVNTAIIDFFKRGDAQKPIDLVPDFDEDKVQMSDYLSALKDNAAAVNSGNLSGPQGQPAIDSLNTHFEQVVKGISVYQGAADNASQYSHVIDFLADTQVNKYSVSKGGIANADSSSQALDVLTYQYENSLIPLIKEEWQNATLQGQWVTSPDRGRMVQGEAPVGKYIYPEFTGSGILFKGSGDVQVTRKVKELNKKVAPLLNKMIRAQATLEGTSDFKAIYERDYAEQLFGKGEVDEGQK